MCMVCCHRAVVAWCVFDLAAHTNTATVCQLLVVILEL